jgi:hypothetical protein
MSEIPQFATLEVAELQADEEFMAAYMDKSHVGHKQAVAEMTAAYENAADAETDGASASQPQRGKAAPVAPPMLDIAALKSDTAFLAAYLDKSHVGHKQAVAEMTAAYESAAGATPQPQGGAAALPTGTGG